MKRSNGLLRLLPALLLLVPLAGRPAAAAEPLTRDRTPEPLRPWVDWVLYDHEEARCPFFQGAADRRQCLWPSRLVLDLGERGGRFTQNWMTFKDAWVPLPGDARYWPQEVRIDGKPAVVAPRDLPKVRLTRGRHTVSGAFEWDALPPLLQVPTETGLLRLTVRGHEVPFPGRDEQGRLWLQKRPGAEEGESRMEIAVHRSVADDIPLLLTTRLDLQISGKSREALLGRALPDRFVPLSLTSPLPARLEPDGRLRVQVRPGRWTIEIVARHEGPATSLTLQDPGGPWDPDEVWVFDARPHLRLATIEGVPSIDPQQTTLPDEWKRLPAYLIHPGETMRLTEKRRGDSDPAPDRLSLRRTFWLDFEGGGYTVHDEINGVMERGWRLEMPAPSLLGRVAVNGQDQFITRLGETTAAGVEIRQGKVRLEADSRLPGRVSSLPAVGWDRDFQQVTGALHLAPGWRLFHASGVDDVSTTWISAWTLLDLFLVLIATMAVAKLWGRNWGALTLAALALTWIEPGAPRWSWLAVLLGEALRRALPAGRLLRLVRLYHLVAMAVLALVAIPFLVQQVRAAIYPVLEYSWSPTVFMGMAATGDASGIGFANLEGYETAGRRAGSEETVQEGEQPEANYEVNVLSDEKVAGGVISGALGASAPPLPRKKADYSSFLNAIDPATVVQTGPGLPDWSWRTVTLGWRGPVKQTQRLHFFLVPPGVNFVLAFLRVALLALLAICLLGLAGGARVAPLLRRIGLSGGARLALILATLLCLAPRPARADMPPADLLEALRGRLLAPPECSPDCASSPRLALEASPSTLRVRQELQAAAETAVPLPGAADQWIPQQVLLDGAPAAALLRTSDGRLWLQISPGVHQVVMDGPLPDRESIQIPFPLRPHRVTARAQGWRIDGLREDGLVDDSLQLTQLRGGDRRLAHALEPGTLPPFVRVERELRLGLKWQVGTRVVRLSPPGAPVLLEVPLLAGESVTSAEVRVANGRAQVNLGPQVSQIAWESSLSEAPLLELRSPDSVPWVEIWRVMAGPMWHLEPKGIPVIHLPEQGEVRVREWRPWPGEAVSIAVGRPQGVAGPTLTLDRAYLTLHPGLRATDASLDLTARSSRGGQHTVTLPEGVELQTVSINDAVQPIRQEGRDVTLPITPGRQTISLSWRQNAGIRAFFRAPEVRLGVPSVNAEVQIDMPADRWTLVLWGPRLGPAVLFWGLLVVSLLLSLGLGTVRQTPLRWQHWFLLSLGLTQVPLWVALGIVAWILVLGWRRERGAALGKAGFDTMQILLTVWTPLALAGLFWSIQKGLLGLPEMQITGNWSLMGRLRWYLDRAGETLPRPWVFSIPVMIYRLAMLAWALWLAQALLRWLRWAWGCFTEGGLWRPLRKPRVAPPPVTTGA
ncbi:MAG TPA: hypothetical protein VFT43_09795 [Candidatus Polarisedimenticolia bacterium]|nr:hypothetical protein [Candidatus Polarisedimenticolia bacterium]